MILVPYPHAWRYQKVNADFLAERGAALHLDDETLPQTLLPTVEALLADEARLAAMGAQARILDTPGAASRLAQLILSVGRGETA
jgi:UDP-N-acetylglucosamine--N-acetylmuramyl-(pentapeptide) pyrophosphoryl-undecaprenol N-acetylglucosamine transferase